jgi:hypothetical protein
VFSFEEDKEAAEKAQREAIELTKSIHVDVRYLLMLTTRWLYSLSGRHTVSVFSQCLIDVWPASAVHRCCQG